MKKIGSALVIFTLITLFSIGNHLRAHHVNKKEEVKVQVAEQNMAWAVNLESEINYKLDN